MTLYLFSLHLDSCSKNTALQIYILVENGKRNFLNLVEGFTYTTKKGLICVLPARTSFPKPQGAIRLVSPIWKAPKRYKFSKILAIKRGKFSFIRASFFSSTVDLKHRSRDSAAYMNHMEALGRLASVASHEIRNPLTVATGYLQLMKKGMSPANAAYYNEVNESLKQINQVITRFLALDRKRAIIKQPDCVNRIIAGLWEQFSAQSSERGILLYFMLDDAIPATNVAPEELSQALIDLLQNAMDATEQGGILGITTHYQNHSILIRVSDSGMGITDGEKEQIFTPFYTTKKTGNGLGLPICLNIVEGHDGTMSVQSHKGVGTTITLVLPLL